MMSPCNTLHTKPIRTTCWMQTDNTFYIMQLLSHGLIEMMVVVSCHMLVYTIVGIISVLCAALSV
jgi:hypothetical protein